MNKQDLINSLKILITEAGNIILARKQEKLLIETKEDNSPVTNADREANNLICSSLNNMTPHIPVISEEGVNPHITQGSFWLVDPIDGTKSYIQGKGTYTVNIALIENYLPKIGLIYQPTEKKLYYTDYNDNLKIEHDNIDIVSFQNTNKNSYIATIGNRQPALKVRNFLQNFLISETLYIPSSLKLCLIAEGRADIYPNFSQKMQWDIAAGHALIRAGGGDILTTEGNSLQYNNNLEINQFYACSRRFLPIMNNQLFK